jgi:hypothetical protein
VPALPQGKDSTVPIALEANQSEHDGGKRTMSLLATVNIRKVFHTVFVGIFYVSSPHKLCTISFNASLVTAIKLQDKHRFHAASTFFSCIL